MTGSKRLADEHRDTDAVLLTRLQNQYERADALMVLLAVAAAGEERRRPVWDRLADADRVVAAQAFNHALHLVGPWRNRVGLNSAWLARYAAADAVASVRLRDQHPKVADALGAPWQAALEVRARLRELGPEIEAVALRLVPSWRANLRDLPTAAVEVSLPPATGT